MHRRSLCVDGGYLAGCHPGAALAHALASWPPGRTTSSRDLTSEIWNEDENRTTTGELKDQNGCLVSNLIPRNKSRHSNVLSFDREPASS